MSGTSDTDEFGIPYSTGHKSSECHCEEHTRKRNWFIAMKHYLQRKSQKDSIKNPHRISIGVKDEQDA